MVVAADEKGVDAPVGAGQVLEISPTKHGRGKRILMRWLFGGRSTGRLLVWPDEYPQFREYYRTD